MRTAGSNRLPGELRAADFEPGSPSHRLGFIAGSRTRPCSGFLASRPRKDVSLPWSFFHIETRSTMLRVTCCLRRS